MKSICTISVPSIWREEIGICLNTMYLKERKEKEKDIKDFIEQGYTLFNTHTTVVNGVMYVTYILTK